MAKSIRARRRSTSVAGAQLHETASCIQAAGIADEQQLVDVLERAAFAVTHNAGIETGSVSQAPPRLIFAVDVLGSDVRFMEERGKRQIGVRGLSQQGQDPSPIHRDRPANLCEDVFARLLVEVQVAAGRQSAEALRDELSQLPRRVAEERAEPSVESELDMLTAGEIEDNQFAFARRASQATAELLKKDRGTLGRGKKSSVLTLGTSTPSL
jgi:hypothetical protein